MMHVRVDDSAGRLTVIQCDASAECRSLESGWKLTAFVVRESDWSNDPWAFYQRVAHFDISA